MDLLTALLIAASLSLGSAGAELTNPSNTTEAGSHIIDLGAPSAAQPSPGGDTTEARSHIIDLGRE